MAAQRPKLAAITTVYRKHSHTQHIVDRFLEGYGWNGAHHHPPMDLVALYVDQVGRDDLSRDRASRFPQMKIYPTIAEALGCGTGKLAVDGVVIVGEHGNYPKTEKGQVQYPRYRFFEEMLAVFRASGRSVPVFNDKHLSWNWDWAHKMYSSARELGFAFMAGSSPPPGTSARQPVTQEDPQKTTQRGPHKPAEREGRRVPQVGHTPAQDRSRDRAEPDDLLGVHGRTCSTPGLKLRLAWSSRGSSQPRLGVRTAGSTA